MMTASLKKDTAYYKKELQNPIFLHWLTLNYCPSRWVHHSWIDLHAPGIHEKLLHRPPTQRFLQDKLALPRLDWDFFNTPLSRLLFIPSQPLQHILSVLGALCYQVQLNVMIEKSFHQQLAEQIPRESLEYIEKTGPLLLSQRSVLMDAVRDNIPLWNPEKKQLVNLTKLGEYIVLEALKYSLLKGANSKSNSEVDVWALYLKYTFPANYPTSMSDSQSAFERIKTPADQHMLTLIIKLFRHLESEYTGVL